MGNPVVLVAALGGLVLLTQLILFKLWFDRSGATAQRALLSCVGLLGCVMAAGLAVTADRLDLLSRFFALSTSVNLESGDDEGNDPALLKYIASQAPSFNPTNGLTPTNWEEWQTNLRSRLISEVFKLGEFRPGPPPNYAFGTRQTLRSLITRQELKVESFGGARIPMFLFTPRTDVPRPAIIVIPGHVPEGESGLEQTAGLVKSYQHGAALRLAEAGFVTLTLELRGFGRLGPPRFPEHRIVAYNALLGGSFYKAILVRDIKRAVDLLETRKEVDPSRIGITGASFGGELAVTYAAIDPRLKSVVFQSFGGTSGVVGGHVGTAANQPHYCHIIPGRNLILRQEDMFLLIAPRPLLGVRGTSEPFHDPSFMSTLKRAWVELGGAENIELSTVPGAHEYFIDPAIEFFRKHL